MKVSFLVTRDHNIEYWITVTGKYTPYRPPPMCSDHDSPAFSDPGDDAEFDVESVEVDEAIDEEWNVIDETHPLHSLLLKEIELRESDMEFLMSAADDSWKDAEPFDCDEE